MLDTDSTVRLVAVLYYGQALMCTATISPTHLPNHERDLRPWPKVMIAHAHDLLFGIAAGRHQECKRFACCLPHGEQTLTHMQTESTTYDNNVQCHDAYGLATTFEVSAPACLCHLIYNAPAMLANRPNEGQTRSLRLGWPVCLSGSSGTALHPACQVRCVQLRRCHVAQ